MDLLMVPNANGDGIRLANIPANPKKQAIRCAISQVQKKLISMLVKVCFNLLANIGPSFKN